MGWFSKKISHIYNNIKHKVKKINWGDIADKAKRGWTIGTQILGKARSFAGKAKKFVSIAATIPQLEEYAVPLLAGIEATETALGVVDDYRKKGENIYSTGSSFVRQAQKGKTIPPPLVRNSMDTKMRGAHLISEGDIYALD